MITLYPFIATAMSNASDQSGIQIGKMFQAAPVELLNKNCIKQDADRDVVSVMMLSFT